MNNRFEIPHQNIAGQHVPLKDEILAALGEVIDAGMFVFGEEVSQFEEKFAELIGVKYAVAVNSGTDALILSLKVLGIGEGDEVITVSNSFVATGACIALVGAKPVFIDVADDYNMDPELLEAAINKNTKAILPVHLTGRPANMTRIMEIAKKHNLFVVEDAAQAVCAELNEQRVGSFGELGCFSLHPLKTLNACGDGGVMTTNDPEKYEELLRLRSGGLRTRDDCVEWGHNSRLDTMQAAILLIKLRHVEKWTEVRRANARFYQKELANLPQIKLPVDREGQRAVYHTFVIQAEQRDQLKAYLEEQGIGTMIHYPVPIHLQDAAQDLGYKMGSFPVTEQQAAAILSLPIYPELTREEMEYVVQSLKNFYATEQDDAGSLLVSIPTV
jgi:dTDP-4-amino-4,6-dideoxygalactose transaminase